MVSKIDRAAPGDLEEILALLADESLPQAGVEAHLGEFFVARGPNGLRGCIGLETYGDVGLLRSLAVRPEGRGAGTGRALVERLIEDARERSLEALYLLTTTAERYFPRFGFEILPRDRADRRLEASEEFRGACPDTAVCMVKKLA